jgi:hypothetical protein
MRSHLVALSAVVWLAVTPRSAEAQSFFEKLFGLTPAQPPIAAAPTGAARAMRPVERSSPGASIARSSAAANEQRSEATDKNDDGLRRRPTGRFRAVCVRLCDGYYWPMNNRATAQTLNEMADRCTSACGAEARLFYSENDDVDPAAMTDLAGRRYDALRTAFVYRTKLVSGCSCKPAPWSVAEQSRHAGYAVAAAQAAEKLRIAAVNEAARKEAEQQRLAVRSQPQIRSPSAATAASRDADGWVTIAQSDESLSTTRGDVAAAVSVAEPGPATEPTVAGTPETYLIPTSDAPVRVAGSQSPGEAAPAPRARTIRVTHRPLEPQARPVRQAERPQGERPRAQRVAVSAPAPGGGLGFFSGGKAKYIWPGDSR